MKTLKSSFSEYFANKRIEQTPYYLIALLTFNMIVVVTIAIVLLYNLGFERQKNRLVELVETQAVMINIVAQQEFLLYDGISVETKKKLAVNVIQKIAEAHYRYGGFGQTGEFTLGRRDGDKIQFLIKQRHYKMSKPTAIPWKSELGEPMRQALKGEKGTIIAFDYRGETVLAAYEPIKDLGWGIVAKIDISEIRAPYIKAAEYAFGLTILLALIGSLIFWYFLHTLVQDIEDSRHFNRMLIANSSAGLALCSLDGKILDANKSFLKIIALSSKRIRGLSYFDCISEDAVVFEKEQFRALIQNKHIDPYESTYIGKSGEAVPVKISGKLIMIKAQPYVWLSVDNIKEYKRREAELLLSDAVFHNTSEVIFVTDTSKKIIKINEAFTAVTGFSEEEVLGKDPRILKSGKHDRHFYDEMFHTINSTGKWRGEIWNKRKNGELFPSLQSISAIRDETGKLIRYVAVLSDITLQKAYEEKLLIDSHHDVLTGLPNRLFFNQVFTQVLARSERNHQIFALFFIDLNQFKEVNDTYGHECGDILLKTVAKRLKETIRSDDFVARLGGDEFTIILETIKTKEEAVSVAKTLLDKTEQPIVLENCDIIPSISIGIAFYPQDGADASTLLKSADKAMYHAKHETIVHFTLCSEL
ncbi:diguanylate cyclase with PAS/PAC sensor [Sulfuricurvum kujiense DSM 16994]|uniref:Diguanylate cyclase with PAS/PAC sensor n=1 Tax=Sulfuricurvum kujiense (strain ATCC BAA-921 / DSM 16994 / JCM 11577 / YK-1) TaxID=709032 RepID=E4TY50_SULKY|nr:diguanylate cyclase [Sulfuricurvum kujiense]ADR33970.1 diguanylate cyclase with PAS/PAC sensor [Sulfuricurvum kujiense DSM 16994]